MLPRLIDRDRIHRHKRQSNWISYFWTRLNKLERTWWSNAHNKQGTITDQDKTNHARGRKRKEQNQKVSLGRMHFTWWSDYFDSCSWIFTFSMMWIGIMLFWVRKRYRYRYRILFPNITKMMPFSGQYRSYGIFLKAPKKA